MADRTLEDLYGVTPSQDPDARLRQSQGFPADPADIPRPRGRGQPVRPSDVTPQDTERLSGVRAARDRAAAQPKPAPRPMSKQQETQAAIAQMKQAEGRPLSQDEAGALEMWQLSGQMRDAAGQKTVVRQRNAMHGDNKANIAATSEAQRGIMAGQGGEFDARLEHERNVEAFRARVSLEEDMVAAGIAAKEQKRQDLLDESVQASRESQRLVAEAAQKFQRTPAVDPNRYWASRTAGQKFGAVMMGIAKGLLKQDPLGHIQSAIAEDVAAQKSNLDQAQRGFTAMTDAANTQSNAYKDIREAVADDRTADMIYERARLQQAQSEFDWWMQKGQVTQLSAEQQTFKAEIAQRTANLDLEIAQRTQANPKFFTRVVGNSNAKALNTRAGKLEDFALDTLKGSQDQRGKMEIEGLKAQGDGGMSEQEKSRSWEQRKWIAEKTAPKRLELEAIRKFQEEYKDDIPGVSAGGKDGRTVAGAVAGFQTGFIPGAIIGAIVGRNSSELTAEQRDAKAKLQRIVYLRLRPESGAAIPDTEVEKDAAQIVDSWSSEEDVHRWLANRGDEATSFIDYYERAPDQGEVEQYRRANVQDPRGLVEQSGIADPTAIDEDAIPYKY